MVAIRRVEEALSFGVRILVGVEQFGRICECLRTFRIELQVDTPRAGCLTGRVGDLAGSCVRKVRTGNRNRTKDVLQLTIAIAGSVGLVCSTFGLLASFGVGAVEFGWSERTPS